MTGRVAALPASAEARAIVVLLASCTAWGLLWWPLKGFAARGLDGPWMTLASYGVVAGATLPLLWRERAAWQPQAWGVAGIALVGGSANAAFMLALLQGDVVRVMLLFYLSPVWAVLGGRLFLGEAVGPRRAAAVAAALLGAFLVIGGPRAFDTPLSTADLLALYAGVAFAGNNLIARASQQVPLATKSVAVFVGCALVSALCLALGLGPGREAPAADLPLALLVAAFGLLWIGFATATWQYGVTRLEAGRAGVILITELMVAVLSAVALGAQVLSPAEWAGAALIAGAAVIEAVSPAATPPTPQGSRA